MAGSLAHIVNEDDGTFRMDLIENLGDAHEALQECFNVIRKFEELHNGQLEIILHNFHYPELGDNGMSGHAGEERQVKNKLPLPHQTQSGPDMPNVPLCEKAYLALTPSGKFAEHMEALTQLVICEKLKDHANQCCARARENLTLSTTRITAFIQQREFEKT